MEGIIAQSTIEDIVPLTSQKDIVPLQAIDFIVSAEGIDQVGGRRADQNISTLRWTRDLREYCCNIPDRPVLELDPFDKRAPVAVSRGRIIRDENLIGRADYPKEKIIPVAVHYDI